jgi:pyridoxine 4-dehydrogenase
MLFGDAEISRIGLGTNRLTNTQSNRAFIEEAVAAGVGMIDSAHLYTRGESEATIGAALGGRGRDGSYVVATKGGYNGASPDVLRAELEESLRTLRSEAIDLYYLHRVDPHTSLEDSLAVIEEQRVAGRIRQVGVSNVSVEQLERARQVVPVAAVQNHYSLKERGSEDVVDYCTEQEIVFVPYFPLRGAAAGAALDEVATTHGATPRQVALAWLLRRSPIIVPIPGTLSIDHLRENLAALAIELSDAEFEALG